MSDESRLNTGIPHTARVWNYWLGGKDNYTADRELGDQIRALLPDIVTSARADRAFLGRAVTHMVTDGGVRQFLDLGTGLPTADNTHEVAQRLAQESRIVYVDNDPLVLAHANALLTSSPGGVTDYIQADVRDVDAVLDGAAKSLDFSEPIAVMMLGIVNFIVDDDQAHEVVGRIKDAVPSGSYLAIAHPTAEINGDAARESVRMSNEAGVAPMCLRSAEEIASFFDGFDLLEPGVVSCSRWRPVISAVDGPPAEVYQFCAVGRKP
ncbi:SAM-dependent methyltransferase [Nonomuraea sp. NPDC050536]|uniref:SAM-dependent methyltransferase n=1 Tax=Nonomuraea sp. NPDC050536 TaxID=3364366 RepID=UPI0037C53B0A